ncbi:unnamed protein product [Nezara viridula]|uniref:Uncharacterized protein n=1 Tax=Nezara viridula TaxID=85310 RepID=A0A9P0HI06_NEZVI|nr:unnamed protein product [Nezara viridula]
MLRPHGLCHCRTLHPAALCSQSVTCPTVNIYLSAPQLLCGDGGRFPPSRAVDQRPGGARSLRRREAPQHKNTRPLYESGTS